jgi:DNA-binding LacI/PurR family transcriptional regulator
LLPEDIKAEDKFGRINGLIETFPETDPQELLARYVRRFPGVGFLNKDSSSETFEMGYRATRRLLEEEPDVNGIIYLSDYYALGGAKYLIEKGCKIGQDIAIAGFNNTNAVRFSGIPVMTADHRVDVISKKLIDNIEGREPYSSIVKPEVIFY